MIVKKSTGQEGKSLHNLTSRHLYDLITLLLTFLHYIPLFKEEISAVRRICRAICFVFFTDWSADDGHPHLLTSEQFSSMSMSWQPPTPKEKSEHWNLTPLCLLVHRKLKTKRSARKDGSFPDDVNQSNQSNAESIANAIECNRMIAIGLLNAIEIQSNITILVRINFQKIWATFKLKIVRKT